MGIEDEKLLRQLYPERYKSNELRNILPDTPQTTIPVITQQDLFAGYITRYFVRPVNDKSLIYEIDKIQYDRFQTNPRFLVTTLRWKITGKKETTVTPYGATIFGTRDINLKEVSNANLTFGGLLYYINDFLQYWQIEDPVTLRTDPNRVEQTLPTPTPTPSPSPMVTPTPTPTPMPSPSMRRIVSVIGYANPIFADGTTSPVANIQINITDNAFYVGSSATFTYELLDQRYRFINWVAVTSQQIVVGGVQTTQEVEQILSADNPLTLTIPNNDVKIRGNFGKV